MSPEEEPGDTLPPARDKAKVIQLAEDKFAVVDHISPETCCRQKNIFFEAKHVNPRIKNGRGRICAVVFQELSEVANGIHHQHHLATELELKLERRIKMFFLISTLIFWIKGEEGLKKIIRARINLWRNNQWTTLIDDPEKDIYKTHSSSADNSRSPASSTKSFNVRRGIELITAGQMSRGSKALLSKGFSDANREEIKCKMQSKFPKWKKLVVEPTETQWESERASLDRDIFRKCIMKLRGQVSPGLTGFRNEHIIVLLFSDASNADMLAKSAFDELFALSNDIVQGKLPWYFYQAWNGTSLTALNKKVLRN